MTTSSDIHPSDTKLHCPECDYNLTGTVEDRCPWCGWVIDEDVLTAIELERSPARQLTATLTCAVCGVGSLVGVVSLVRHSTSLSLRDGLAAVGVLIAAAGHIGLAGLLVALRRQWPIYRADAGALFRFAGWFSIALGIAGATEMFRQRDVQGVPVAATFEFALAATFYTLPGAALLVMRMVSFRDRTALTAVVGRRRLQEADRTSRAPFSIDAVGRFDEGHVHTEYVGAAQPADADAVQSIGQAWESARALAEADDLMLFDGPLIRLRHAAIEGAALRLDLGLTSYRAFVGTNMNPEFVAREGWKRYLADPLGISASVITSDGFIAYGRRGPRVAFQAGYVHPFGGMVDQSDRRDDGSVDLFGAMLRELNEEAGLTRDDVGEIVVVGLVRDRRILQPELIFDVSVRCTRREVQERFNPASSDGEHDGIEFLHDDPEAAIASLSRFDRITPVAEAAYLLHGRACWGAEWFEQTCLIRYGETPPATAYVAEAID